jgi:beta-aspartyl-dipeptidase (metallo-type)
MLTLLLDADLYAPEPLGHRHLLVGGGKVLWTGVGRPDLPVGLGVEVADCGGRRVIPGLVDAHVHVTGGGGEAGPNTKVPPVPLSRFTRAGITTVVGVLGTDDTTRTPGELVTAIYALRTEGLSAWCYTGGYHVPPATVTGSVRGDLAFVECVIGVGEVALSDHRSSQPTLDELLRIAADAHVGGLLTGKAGIVHLHLGDGARGLELVRQALDGSELPARVFNPTHVNRRRALFQEAVELARLGCTIDITAFPVEAGEDAWPAEVALIRYLDAGAPPERVTVSTDGGGCLPRFDAEGRVAAFDVGLPDALIGCLRACLAAGEPLARVLPAFTSNPAGFLRLPGKGHLAVGADADLVVLDQAGDITDVMALGAWHVRDRRVMVRGTFDKEDA